MVDDSWLALVKIARDAGDVSSLLPPGIKSLYDAPAMFVTAFRNAMYFLSFEELPEDERPPKKIWMNNDRMKRWWDEVKLNRKNKAEGGENMARNAYLDEAFKGVKFVG